MPSSLSDKQIELLKEFEQEELSKDRLSWWLWFWFWFRRFGMMLMLMYSINILLVVDTLFLWYSWSQKRMTNIRFDMLTCYNEQDCFRKFPSMNDIIWHGNGSIVILDSTMHDCFETSEILGMALGTMMQAYRNEDGKIFTILNAMQYFVISTAWHVWIIILQQVELFYELCMRK